MKNTLVNRAETTTLRLEDYNKLNTNVRHSSILGFVIFGCLVVAGFVGGAAYWAASSKLDGAVVAPASFVVEGNRRTVQHLDGGIVRNILVSNGEMVTAGQTLIELDSTELDVDVDIIAGQIADATVRRARLVAQLQGATTFEASDVTKSLNVPLDPALWTATFETQRLLFASGQRSLAADEALTEQRIASLTDQIEGLEEQRLSNRRQLEIVEEELGNLRTLLAKGLVAKVRVNTRSLDEEQLKSVDTRLQSEIRQARNQIDELTLASVASRSLRNEEAAREIAQIDATLATLQPQLNGAAERLGRVAIKAPVSGRVVEMTLFTAGGVVRPGVPILDIVPDDEPLIVEARVNPTDIEDIFPGQRSRVRLAAFDLSDVPEAQGRVEYVSADIIEDDRTGEPHYLVRVRLDATQSADVEALEIVAGMPADVFVNTGERTALAYLTQPIMDRLARTFIE